MKNFLYGTTALVAASLVAGMANAAEPLKIGVSGSMQQWFGVVSQESSEQGNATNEREYNNFGMNTDTQIDFKASTKLDNGLAVEAVVKLNTWDNNGSGANTGTQQGAVSVDEQYASVGGRWGTIYGGVRRSMNHYMHNEAIDYGITYGDVDQWIVQPRGMRSFGGQATNANLNTANNNWDGTQVWAPSTRLLGLQYVTPKLYGFSLGVSYAPNGISNAANAGTGIQNISNSTGSAAWHDIADATLAYSGELAGVKIGADFGAGHASRGSSAVSGAATTVAADTTSLSSGIKLGYAGFTLAGGFVRVMEGDDRPAGAVVNQVLDGHAWNAGLAYATGPWGVSYTYYLERHQGSTDTTAGAVATGDGEYFQTHLLSGKYNLGPGVDLKSSAFWAQYNTNTRSSAGVPQDGRTAAGYGLVTGIDLTF